MKIDTIKPLLVFGFCFAALAAEAQDRLAPILESTPPGRIVLLAQNDPVQPVISTSETPRETAAAEPASPPAGSVPPPMGVSSQSVVMNLIKRMVQRGLLTEEDSQELMRQAEGEAVEAAEQQMFAQAAAMKNGKGAPSSEPAQDGAVSVTYVPEFMKNEMREQIKQEVLDTARDENWASPRSFPSWVSHLRFFGDFRGRYQGDFFPAGNDASGAFPNFNAINTGNPFDTTGANFPSEINVDEDRNRLRLRARFGVEADLLEGFTTGLRIGTGESSSPVSQNQSLGAASSGGNFSNYAIWLDRAFLRYQLGQPDKKMGINIGRFDNPFFSPSQLVWDNDLAFDGIAFNGRYEVTEGVVPFATAGGFPIYNTDFNFASNRPDKFPSEDKWLLGGQGGLDWKISKDFNWKVAAAFYYFENVEGRLSTPYVPLSAADAGDTDGTRPSFAQKGNTYRELRNILPDASNGFGTTNQFQYYGLATEFQDLVLSSRLDYSGFDPFHVWLTGEFVKNVAFDRDSLNAFSVNNQTSGGTFDGGDTGWTVALNLGKVALEKRWDWNFNLGYKYVETDAVVDGFTDSDFGGGGTNLQGYFIGGNVLLSPHVSAGLNWMSADSIAGPTLKQDVIQIDINAKF